MNIARLSTSAIGVIFISLMLALVPSRSTQAQTPATTLSPSVTATDPPQTATPTPASPTAAPSPGAPTVPGSIRSRLVEDTDGDGRVSATDRRTVRTLIALIFWSRVPASPVNQGPPVRALNDSNPTSNGWFMNMFSGEDGSFAFDNVPPGMYTLQIWWAGGFVNGATERLPDLYRAIIQIEADGRLTAPAQLPATWPESYGYEDINVVRDHIGLGPLPSEILLKPAIPGVFAYPISDNTSRVTDVGTVDVAAALARIERPQLAPPRVALPPTGSGPAGGQRRTSLGFAAALAALALGAALVRHARR